MEYVHTFPHFQTLSKEITFNLICVIGIYQTSSFAEKTYCWPFALLPKKDILRMLVISFLSHWLSMHGHKIQQKWERKRFGFENIIFCGDIYSVQDVPWHFLSWIWNSTDLFSTRREKENKGQFEAFCERTSLQNNCVFIVTQRQLKKKCSFVFGTLEAIVG